MEKQRIAQTSSGDSSPHGGRCNECCTILLKMREEIKKLRLQEQERQRLADEELSALRAIIKELTEKMKI